MRRVVGGPKQTKLFARKADENDGVARTLGRMGQNVGQFENTTDAGGVVVSAVVNLTLLTRSERILAAQAEMIVMCTNHDVLGSEFWVGPRQLGDDIRYPSLDPLTVPGHRHPIGSGERHQRPV